MLTGRLYDGTTAVAHVVDIAILGDVLQLSMPDGWQDDVPATSLAQFGRDESGLTLMHRTIEGWRLKVPAPVPAALDAMFPAHSAYGAWIDRLGLWRAAAAFAAFSAALVAIGWFVPAWLAPLVPQSVERAYGQALVGDFGGKFCSTSTGNAALASLVAKLDPDPESLNVRVVDIPVVNAAALPAGNIMIFDRLLKETDTPDELAGVLAHEIAHVRRRHVTAALLREFGVSIFTTALGGSTAGRIDNFVGLSFTRRGEGEADRDALATLTRAHISPVPTATFFRKLKKMEVDAGRLTPALAYVSSHPLSGDREKLFRTAAVKGAAYQPALSPEQWTALRSICQHS